MPESLVLLHGFGGTARAWDGVVARLSPERYLPLALDLPGHGGNACAPRPITFHACVEQVLARAPERFTLCGYSLGGRVALHVALAAPDRVRALVIVAASAGIEDPAERLRRVRSDEQLARGLETAPYEEFIERWRTQPLFAEDPSEVGDLARADQRRNDPVALAAVLRGLGAGTMEPLWGRLAELRMPALVLAGERDRKFRAAGARMAGLLPKGRLQILPGGHGLPLESPTELARALQRLDAEPRPGR